MLDTSAARKILCSVAPAVCHRVPFSLAKPIDKAICNRISVKLPERELDSSWSGLCGMQNVLVVLIKLHSLSIYK